MSDPSANGAVPRGWVPAKPCPVCGREKGWCSRTLDGKVVMCRFMAEGAYSSREDVNGSPYHLHHFEDGKPVPDWSTYRKSFANRARLDDLHTVYGRLLLGLGLDKVHRENLRERGLTDDEIDERCYRSLPPKGRGRIAAGLEKEFGKGLLLRVPGFAAKEENRDSCLTVLGKSGLLIPVTDDNARIVALKVRADQPVGGCRYLYLSSRKYGGPGPGSPVNVPTFHPRSRPVDVMRITEGELKSDIITARTGVLTLGCPGVALWRPALALAMMPAPRKILLAFDSDARNKPEVARALKACAQAIKDITN
jgi:hypothetical protein